MDGKLLQAVDLLDLMKVLGRKKKVHQKVFLNGLEEVIGKETQEFRLIRKLFLDHSNDFFRETLTQIFGADFEGNLD